jgi:hypothetical protein
MCPFAFSSGAILVFIIAYWRRFKKILNRKK